MKKKQLAPTEGFDEQVRTVALIVLAVIATGAALHWLSPVLVPFALALFLSIALAPLIDGLARRWRLSRTLAVVVAMLLGGVVLLALGGIVALSVREFSASSAMYAQNLEALGMRLMDPSGTYFGRDLGQLVDGALESLTGTFQVASAGLLGGLGSILSNGFSVFIFLMFLLLEQRRPEGGLARLLDARVQGYVAIKVLTSGVTGALVGAALALLGIDGALLFGLLTFLLNFIPTLGSIIAVLLPLPIVLAGGHSVTVMVLALMIPTAIQFVIGQVWENKKLGDEFDLRASVVLLALVIFGQIFGLVGMVLSTPITAVLRSILADWPLTAPLAAAMAEPRAERPPRA